MGRIMRIMAGDARDVVLFLSEDPSLCSLLGIQQLSFIGGMAARTEGTVGMGLYRVGMRVVVPDLHQIVGSMRIILGQDPPYRGVTSATGAGADIYHDVFLAVGFQVKLAGAMAGLATDVSFCPSSWDRWILRVQRAASEAGEVTGAALTELLRREIVPLRNPVVVTVVGDATSAINVGNSLAASQNIGNVLPGPDGRFLAGSARTRQWKASPFCLIGSQE